MQMGLLFDGRRPGLIRIGQELMPSISEGLAFLLREPPLLVALKHHAQLRFQNDATRAIAFEQEMVAALRAGLDKAGEPSRNSPQRNLTSLQNRTKAGRTGTLATATPSAIKHSLSPPTCCRTSPPASRTFTGIGSYDLSWIFGAKQKAPAVCAVQSLALAQLHAGTDTDLAASPQATSGYAFSGRHVAEQVSLYDCGVFAASLGPHRLREMKAYLVGRAGGSLATVSQESTAALAKGATDRQRYLFFANRAAESGLEIDAEASGLKVSTVKQSWNEFKGHGKATAALADHSGLAWTSALQGNSESVPTSLVLGAPPLDPLQS
jgi:hypothetical protein